MNDMNACFSAGFQELQAQGETSFEQSIKAEASVWVNMAEIEGFFTPVELAEANIQEIQDGP